MIYIVLDWLISLKIVFVEIVILLYIAISCFVSIYSSILWIHPSQLFICTTNTFHIAWEHHRDSAPVSVLMYLCCGNSKRNCFNTVNLISQQNHCQWSFWAHIFLAIIPKVWCGNYLWQLRRSCCNTSLESQHTVGMSRQIWVKLRPAWSTQRFPG